MNHSQEKPNILPESLKDTELNDTIIDLAGREIDLGVFHQQALAEALDSVMLERVQSEKSKEARSKLNLEFIQKFGEHLPRSESGESMRVKTGKDALAVVSSVIWLPTTPTQPTPSELLMSTSTMASYEKYRPFYLIGRSVLTPDTSQNRKLSTVLLLSAQTGELISMTGWDKELDALDEISKENANDKYVQASLIDSYSNEGGEYVINPRTKSSIRVGVEVIIYRKIPNGFSRSTKDKIKDNRYIHAGVDYRKWGVEFTKLDKITDKMLSEFGVVERLAVISSRFGNTAELNKLVHEKLNPSPEAL